MKNITKKQATDFYKAVCQQMAKFPIHPNVWEDHSAWLVETELGPLSVSVYPHQYLLFDIYLRFEKAQGKELEFLGDDVNTYSGKWNIMSGSIELALWELDHRLEKIGAKELV